MLNTTLITTQAPQVVSVSSTPANESYGQQAFPTRRSSDPKAVTLTGGNLQLTLDTGDVISIAPFGPATTASGTYTVGAGDTSSDLTVTSNPLTLSGGTLRDAALNNCVLTIPAGQNLGNLKN